MLNQELFNERMEICKKCPLYKEDKIRGPICDSNKFISSDGTKGSWFRKEGYIRGCGCHLTSKIRSQNNSCIVGKW